MFVDPPLPPSRAPGPDAEALEFARSQPATIPGERPDGARCLEVYGVLGDEVVVLPLFAPGRGVRLGTGLGRPAPHLTAPAEVLPLDDLTLFEPVPAGGGWALRYADDWEGEIVTGGVVRSLRECRLDAPREPDGLRRLVLGPDDQVRLRVGPLAIVARAVRPARALARPPLWRLDPVAVGIGGFMMFALVMLGVVVAITPPAPAATTQSYHDRLVSIPLRPAPPPSPSPTSTPKPGKVASGERAPSPVRGGRARGPGAGRVFDPFAMVDVDSILGGAELPGSIREGVQGLIGVHATGGRYGLEGRNLGGGTAVGGPGGPGFGRPGGRGGDDPWGGAGLTKREGGSVRVADDPILLGGIHADLVDKVVKRHLAAIRFCYQHELQRDPSLSGKVSVNFTIAKDGSVSSAKAGSSTLGSPAVEACISSRFLRMEFPPIEGGGIAIVKYPFFFSPG